MDLMLSVVDRDYYSALRDYHRGVAERNQLFKKGGSAGEFSAFEAEMATRAYLIAERRAEWIQELSDTLRSIYDGIAEEGEGPEMDFRANADCGDVESFERLFAESRGRDQLLGATQRGPHRDDFTLGLHIGGAREYASDGQQRGLCVALRIAQATFYQARLGRAPVILADDVLGELDPLRREGFWRVCPKEMQIVATGTELPADAEAWAVSAVKDGRVATSQGLP
jgi:DNA replication and repair protein RecF